MKDGDVDAMLEELQRDLVREALEMLVRVGVPVRELRQLAEEALGAIENSGERR